METYFYTPFLHAAGAAVDCYIAFLLSSGLMITLFLSSQVLSSVRVITRVSLCLPELSTSTRLCLLSFRLLQTVLLKHTSPMKDT